MGFLSPALDNLKGRKLRSVDADSSSPTSDTVRVPASVRLLLAGMVRALASSIAI